MLDVLGAASLELGVKQIDDGQCLVPAFDNGVPIHFRLVTDGVVADLADLVGSQHDRHVGGWL